MRTCHCIILVKVCFQQIIHILACGSHGSQTKAQTASMSNDLGKKHWLHQSGAWYLKYSFYSSLKKYFNIKHVGAGSVRMTKGSNNQKPNGKVTSATSVLTD
jgi:hypothetical protein